MMKFVVVLSALVAVACAGTINPGWRIVGGSEAADGQFPYIVSLRKRGSHSCGGSILSANWVLTAAHCVEGATVSSLSVIAGSNTLNSGGTAYLVAEIIVHEDYNVWTVENDVAVLRLQSSIQFNEKVQQIKPSSGTTGGNAACTLSGWGTTSYPGSIPNDLQFLPLMTVSNAQCMDAHVIGSVYASNICTLTQSGEGACHGDSGGPLVDASGEQIGIVSWGRPCAVGYPDVFTRVASFANWIATNTS